MITITSLTHPVMIAKIRHGLRCAALGNGHELGGHDNTTSCESTTKAMASLWRMVGQIGA
jgi:hypothetical protein